MRVAIIENGVVINVIISNSVGEGEVDVTDLIMGPGWFYDGQTFTPPPVVDPPIIVSI